MESVYDSQSLRALCRDPYRQKRFRTSFFKHMLPLDECLSLAPELENRMVFQSLEMIERHDSRRDGATKLVFRTHDGQRIESVLLRIASGRSSLCVSSQVGCASGCVFCATAGLGFVRNLSVAEMLDQVVLAGRLLRGEGRRLRNVVFMGMGEPLRNEAVLYPVLDALRDPYRFYLSDQHLTVSTVGIPDAMIRFAQRFPAIRLALSLHSARQEVRERLMPIARGISLDRLRTVFPVLAQTAGFMVEVLLLKGVNDGPADLAALIEYLNGTDAHINLIQFNAYPGAPFEPVDEGARRAFAEALRRAGFMVTLRYSLGDDIAAACGQLAAR